MKKIACWGRMNPPTKGHGEIIRTAQNLANKWNCEYYLFVTQTETKPIDIKKAKAELATKKLASQIKESIAGLIRNPFNWEEKVTILKELYGKTGSKYKDLIISEYSEVNTITRMLDKMKELGTTDLEVVLGEDRVDEFENIFTKYQNATEVPFDSLKIAPIERFYGISATKMRLFVLQNDRASFINNIDTDNKSLAEEIFELLYNKFESFGLL